MVGILFACEITHIRFYLACLLQLFYMVDIELLKDYDRGLKFEFDCPRRFRCLALLQHASYIIINRYCGYRSLRSGIHDNLERRQERKKVEKKMKKLGLVNASVIHSP